MTRNRNWKLKEYTDTNTVLLKKDLKKQLNRFSELSLSCLNFAMKLNVNLDSSFVILSLVVARQNVPITSILTNCVLGSWKDFDVDILLIGSKEMIWKTCFADQVNFYHKLDFKNFKIFSSNSSSLILRWRLLHMVCSNMAHVSWSARWIHFLTILLVDDSQETIKLVLKVEYLISALACLLTLFCNRQEYLRS